VSTYGERNYASSRGHATATSIPNGAWTVVPYDTPQYEDGIAWESGASSLYRIPVDGYYQDDAAGCLAAHATGYRSFSIYQNSTPKASTSVAPSGSITGMVASVTVKCIAGDYITGRIWHNAGVALAMAGTTNNNFLTVTKVPAPVVNGAAASGVWGVGNLAPAKVGTDDLTGREIYIDQKGQLRSAPLRLDTPHISKNKTISQNLTTASTWYTVIFEEDMQPPVGITYSGGIFTVPEDGIYHLDVHLLCGGVAATATRMAVTVTNPSEAAVNYGNPAWNGQGNSMMNYSRAIRMKAGATVNIQAWAGATGQNVTGSSVNYSTMSLAKIAP
jgi:hypothetical protein